MLLCFKKHQFFLKEHVKNDQSTKNQTGNAVRSEKSDIHFTQIMSFDQSMLIHQHTQKHRRRQPM